jgi:D-alanyl-D-alanine carboxypeptidase/D-alanyl-D-alanine-endopeptidase (penicillin-binding protein 4)
VSHTTDGTPGTGRRAARGDRARRRRRTGLAWRAGGLAVLLVGYGALDAADAVPGPLTTQPPIEVQALPRPSAAAADVTGPSPLPEDAPMPQDLASLVEPVLEEAELTGRLSYDVRDALTGDVLLARGEETASTPASVTKVLTGAAALGALGADARFTTRAVLDESSGVVHVVGGGDVLLGAGESDPDTVLGRAGLATLAQRTAEELSGAGVSSVRVAADLSRYSGDGWHSGWERADIGSGYITPIVPLMQESAFEEPGQRYSSRHEDAAGVALDTFTSALADAGIDAEAAEPAAAPQGATELASVDSAPVSQLVEFMLVNSDNVVAEVLGREVALATGQEASADEAPAAVIDALAAQDLDTGSITLEDTSGLDYDNRISAHDLTTIVQASAQADGDLSLLIPAMPVGGLTGTLFERYRDDESRAGAGVVHAKTGSLATVSSLAGTVLTADDRLLVFSFMADEMDRGTSLEARAAFDTALARIAECGCS